MTKEEIDKYYDYITNIAGCKYIGIQPGFGDMEDMVLFNEPNNSTLAIPRSYFSYGAVIEKLGLPELPLIEDVNDVEIRGISGELILNSEDYLKIIRKEANHGIRNIPAVLKAG